MTQAGPPHVVVVGGGIAGLSAAFFLRETGAAVTVCEGAAVTGGKLAVSAVAGVAVDEGAESVLTRRPEGTGLIEAVGLSHALVNQGMTAARIWSRGRMQAMPRRQVMGVPADTGELSGLLSAEGLERARQDAALPATERAGDVAVSAFVGARFGQEVVERLVDPMLCGVYAGRSDELSFDATLPDLAAESRRHASLAEAAAAVMHAPRPGSSPSAAPGARPSVFTTLAGGLGTLPGAVAAASGAEVRTRTTVRELDRTASGWRLTLGSAHAPEYLTADAVIIATPAPAAHKLLAGVPGAGTGAAALGAIGYASVVIVTLAYPAAAFPGPLEASGYLVPAADGHPVKAVTFSSAKWPHLSEAAPDTVIVRCSLGRLGEERLLQQDDADLASAASRLFAAATGVRGEPAASRVTRWGGALPQYTVGHLGRVAAVRAAVAAQPGLAVCGAAYDGIGIPACVATARTAASQISSYLRSRRADAHGQLAVR